MPQAPGSCVWLVADTWMAQMKNTGVITQKVLVDSAALETESQDALHQELLQCCFQAKNYASELLDGRSSRPTRRVSGGSFHTPRLVSTATTE